MMNILPHEEQLGLQCIQPMVCAAAFIDSLCDLGEPRDEVHEIDR